MKKTFIILCLLAFCFSLADAGIIDKLKGVIARKNVAAGDCDWTAADFGWNGEAGIDNNACYADDSKATGTEVNGDEITTGDATYDTIVTLADTGDQLTWARSATDGLNISSAFCRARISTADITVSGLTYFFRLDDDAGGSLYVSMAVVDCAGSECLRFLYGGTAVILYTGTDTITENTWTNVEWAWDENDDVHSSGTSGGIKVGANAWQYEDDGDVQGDLSGYIPETIIIGTDTGAANQGDVKVEGLECWDDSAKRDY
jgi:hypothetical protein